MPTATKEELLEQVRQLISQFEQAEFKSVENAPIARKNETLEVLRFLQTKLDSNNPISPEAVANIEQDIGRCHKFYNHYLEIQSPEEQQAQQQAVQDAEKQALIHRIKNTKIPDRDLFKNRKLSRVERQAHTAFRDAVVQAKKLVKKRDVTVDDLRQAVSNIEQKQANEQSLRKQAVQVKQRAAQAQVVSQIEDDKVSTASTEPLSDDSEAHVVSDKNQSFFASTPIDSLKEKVMELKNDYGKPAFTEDEYKALTEETCYRSMTKRLFAESMMDTNYLESRMKQRPQQVLRMMLDYKEDVQPVLESVLKHYQSQNPSFRTMVDKYDALPMLMWITAPEKVVPRETNEERLRHQEQDKLRALMLHPTLGEVYQKEIISLFDAPADNVIDHFGMQQSKRTMFLMHHPNIAATLQVRITITAAFDFVMKQCDGDRKVHDVLQQAKEETLQRVLEAKDPKQVIQDIGHELEKSLRQHHGLGMRILMAIESVWMHVLDQDSVLISSKAHQKVIADDTAAQHFKKQLNELRELRGPEASDDAEDIQTHNPSQH